MQQAYNVKLPVTIEGDENPFEGPLDLLLHLIRENRVDIYDIPISHITRQYIEYLELMKELNLEIAGEFILMAATLIHIKSRMLLPVEEVADTDEPEDPRYELVQRLLQYQSFKEASLGLRELEHERSLVMERNKTDIESKIPSGLEDELSLFDLNLFDILEAFKSVLDRAPREVIEITRETLTVKDRISHIAEALQTSEAIRFHELFMPEMGRQHLVVTFVALLELIRLGLAKVYQEKEFTEIWIYKPLEINDAKNTQDSLNT